MSNEARLLQILRAVLETSILETEAVDDRSIAFHPDWPHMLRDLTTCGPVSFEIESL